ncbi:maternal B9.10 protein-like protein [Dinothrombium tinctorium]|uniref:Maternal B9.10 protein-like protein n=1 Tax=Dinothrombium tinctorium TaxID=1965070 RepID=A0A443R3W4_9ACAR|nr:maternal B9.10 protein-like protein [Dinothrombium tinctorium]
MKDEIIAAVSFLTRLIEKNKVLSDEKLNQFKLKLTDLLTEKYKNHWFPEKPSKGQAYRCIRFNENDRRDKMLEYACSSIGISYEDLKLPVELTIWVDPEEVTCRFGEHKGSYCVVASFRDGNKENFIDSINIDELEQKSLERAKQVNIECLTLNLICDRIINGESYDVNASLICVIAPLIEGSASYELMNSRKKRQNGKNGYLKNNGSTPNGLYNGMDYNGVSVTSSPSYYLPPSPYYGSPKYGHSYGSSPPQRHSVQTPTHHSQNMFTPSYPISPPNRSLGGTPFRGPNVFGSSNGGSPGLNGVSSNYGGNKFSRGLHSAFNNAAMAFGPYHQPNDRYHWLNKSIVKA